MSLIRERHDCRLCGLSMKEVFSLPPTPIANSFPASDDSLAEKIPLILMQCNNCEHVQLKHVIDDEALYENYKYSTPDAAVPHLQSAATELRLNYPQAKTVLEIGSNNGLFLRALRGAGFTAVGVDPAATDGIDGYFGEELAKELADCGKYDLIVANNVFAHIDDLNDVFRGIDILLKDDGALVFEVQYLFDLVSNGLFDMIYHEHRDYHNVGPLAAFLQRHGFIMTDWKFIDPHGGSVRLTAKREGKWKPIPFERIDWSAFQNRVENAKSKVNALINGEKIKLFGAPAKATTLIHAFGLQDKIEYCVDSTPAKHGRYIAGTGIKILPEETIAQSKSTTRMLLATWNYRDVIQAKYPDIQFINGVNP